MLTVKEVAERLNVSQSFVYKLVAGGQLQSHRFGNVIRVAEDQLGEFLEQTRDDGGATAFAVAEFKHLKI